VLLDRLLATAPAERLVSGLVRAWSSASARRLDRRVALRRLLSLDELLQERVDALAAGLDDGVHAKHRLMRYHDFFVDRIESHESVLDVGCGKGELAHDIAERAHATVTGIDWNAGSLAFARSRFDDVEFVEADVLAWEPPKHYDVVVLSNVLEHIAPRVELLSRLREAAKPSRMMIRVPSRERDWLVPLRAELGLPHLSDPTHEIEYTREELEQELRASGLTPVEVQQRWGELWVVADA